MLFYVKRRKCMKEESEINCYFYGRSSNVKQTPDFLDVQREQAYQKALSRNMQIIREYCDVGDFSMLKQMLEDIETKKDKVDHVLSFDILRFGYNEKEISNTLQVLEENGLSLLLIKEDLDSNNDYPKILLRSILVSGKES